MMVCKNSSILVVMVLVSVALLFSGCADQCQQQLDQLTLKYQDLQAQSDADRQALDAKTAQLDQCRADLGTTKDQLAAKPDLPEGWEMQKGMVMTSLPEAVLFNAGKAKLKSGAAKTLKTVIFQIRANWPGQDVYIIGHTDSDPISKSNWKDNLELSAQRALAVSRYMVKQGMSARQLIAGGCGQHRPLASNSTASGKAKNRRVEFWILKPM